MNRWTGSPLGGDQLVVGRCGPAIFLSFGLKGDFVIRDVLGSSGDLYSEPLHGTMIAEPCRLDYVCETRDQHMKSGWVLSKQPSGRTTPQRRTSVLFDGAIEMAMDSLWTSSQIKRITLMCLLFFLCFV